MTLFTLTIVYNLDQTPRFQYFGIGYSLKLYYDSFSILYKPQFIKKFNPFERYDIFLVKKYIPLLYNYNISSIQFINIY